MLLKSIIGLFASIASKSLNVRTLKGGKCGKYFLLSKFFSFGFKTKVHVNSHNVPSCIIALLFYL